MSAAQIQRLETLLARVQANRHRPRLETVSAEATHTLATPSAKSAVAPEAAPPKTKTPLEAAMASATPASAPAPAPELEIATAVAERQASPAEVSPEAVAATPPKAAAVAKVVAPAPSVAPATFGDLIARTLALRPR